LKRYFLVTTIVVAMVLSMVGSAFAFDDVDEDATYATDFEVLEAVDVYQGYPDGTAKPDNAITRAEFAAVVVRMLDKEKVADAVAGYETSFTDDTAIADWSRGYIIVANSLGIINGYPDGSFKPANNVTYAEAIAMLARALKLDDAATGSWPTNYLVLGADIGLSEGVDPIANLPITRGEMAIMSVNALFSTWFINDDDELEEDVDENCLLYDLDDDIWADLDDDIWAEYGESEIAGAITDYLSSSGRIKVGGEYYYLSDDIVDLVVNDAGAVDFDFADYDNDGLLPDVLVEDDEVVLTLDSDDEVTKIEVTRDTYEDLFLEDADTDDDETLFGYVTIDGDDLNVDDDTVILLDGEEVILDELVDAWDDFEDEYDTDPLATARTEGDVYADGEYAIYVSVITTNTVEGEVTAVGNDGDPYVRIDGEKVYYDGTYLTVGDPGDFETGDTVTLLLNDDDVAMVLLAAVIEEDDFFGKVVEYTLDDGDLDTVTLVLADGNETTVKSFVAAPAGVDPTTMLNEVVEVLIDGSGDADFFDTTGMTFVVTGAFEDYSSTWIQVDGTKHVIAGDVFVYDTVDEDYIDLDDLDDDPADTVTLYSIDGVVGYITR